MIPNTSQTEHLLELQQRIVSSGLLGRSKTYIKLLEYLVQCSIEDRTPKEIEIAIEVMDRDTDFDVSKDSLVRVYVHNLRKKLESYFSRNRQQEDYVIQIPKGQYTLELVHRDDLAGSDPQVGTEPFTTRHFDLLHWGLAAALVVSIALLFLSNRHNDNGPFALNDVDRIRQHPLWAAILADERPIVLVLGDYYIFGEINPATGEVVRMVREFDINSKRDLENLVLLDENKASSALDLELSYLPTATAFALNDILPVIDVKYRRISVRTMGEMDTAFLKTHHIIYVGYISGMAKLKSLAFQASRYRIGDTEDEIIDNQTGQRYFSGAGIPTPDKRFRDYALISSFPTPDGTQMLLISSTRDEGLMHSAKSLTSLDNLNQILKMANIESGDPIAVETLFEVFGYEGRNFDAKLLNSSQLNTQKIWGGNLTERK